MRPTLTYITAIGPWVIACPVGGGELMALTSETAARGHEEGWLEGYGDVLEGLEQARQTQPEDVGDVQHTLAPRLLTCSEAGATSS